MQKLVEVGLEYDGRLVNLQRQPGARPAGGGGTTGSNADAWKKASGTRYHAANWSADSRPLALRAWDPSLCPCLVFASGCVR